MGWMATGDELRAEILALLPQLVEVRHDLHRHPELGFEEERTQQKVRAWLEARGFTPIDCAGTGLLADLRPDLAARGDSLALRADLDCLPMTETLDVPYRSVHAGRAHKCGHDGHTAILAGVADVLARRREQAPCNIRLLFQPAEEGVRGGGARVMVGEGALEGVKEVYGLHNWPGFPKGDLRVKAGALMAQVHTFRVTVVGKGGHGSQPGVCRDVIVAGSHLVSALQTVVARGLGYEGGAVLSVCCFQAGTTHNVLPNTAKLEGTIRTFHADTTERVLGRLREVLRGTAEMFGVQTELDLEVGFPVLVNHPECAAAVATAGTEVLGADRVSGAGLPMAGGEDFAYLTQTVPGAYFFLGAGVPGEDTPGCHHSDFDFDDDLIAPGMEMFLALCRARC